MGSFQDGLGEVIAAAAALAHDMVNAQGIMVDQLLHRGGQVIGRGRGGKAIRGNGQPGAGGVCGGVVLDNLMLRLDNLPQPRPWKEALNEYINSLQ